VLHQRVVNQVDMGPGGGGDGNNSHGLAIR